MNRSLVYDWPTRIFHWLFVLFFVTAFLIAKLNDDDSPTFIFHMLAGMSIGFLVILRLVWGFIGSKHAQFMNWPLKIAQLKDYFVKMKSGEGEFFAGHNPASSWAGLGMMAAAIGCVVTGLLMAFKIKKHLWEEVHEVAVYSLLALAGAHILGVIMHTVRKKDLIGLSMLDGRKNHVQESEVIDSAKPLAGVVFLVLMIGWVAYLRSNLDGGTIKLFGQTIQLSKESDSESKDD